MTKKKKRILFSVLILGLLVIGLPYLLELPGVKKSLEAKIDDLSGSETRIGRIHVLLFPRPHLSVHDIRLTHEAGTVALKRLEVFPVLGDLFTGNISISAIHLEKPDIRVTDLAMISELWEKRPVKSLKGKDPFPEAAMDLSVADGHLSLSQTGSLAGLDGRIDPLECQMVNLDVHGDSERFQVHGGFVGAYAESVQASVEIIRSSGGDHEWDVRASARDGQMASIQQVLLKVFPDQPVVLKVFRDIIHGGHVVVADFRFNGKTSQWKDLHHMVIDADVQNTVVSVPSTKLIPKQVSGHIRIDNAVLNGSNLKGTLNRSYASNGRLELGLTRGDKLFALELDLDTDVADIPGAIKEFLPDNAQKILTDMDVLTGRAYGHLSLAREKDGIQTRVTAQPVSASFVSRYLDETVILTGGELFFGSHHVIWKGISGQVGPHRVRNTEGAFAWAPDWFLTVKSLNAVIDSETLYKRLVSIPRTESRIKRYLSGLRGPLEIRDVAMAGDPRHLEKATWKGMLTSSGLTVLSPELPEPLTLAIDGAQVDGDRLQFNAVTAKMDNQELTLSGRIEGLSNQNPMGELAIRGMLSRSLEGWLKEKSWIPPMVFPKLPCEIRPLTLAFQPGGITVSGKIRHGNEKGGSIETNMALSIGDGSVHIERLKIRDGENVADIQAIIPLKKDSGNLVMDFKGGLERTTLDRILADRHHPAADISGDFNLVIPEDNKKSIFWSGNASLSKCELDLAEKGTITLKHGEAKESSGRITVRLDDLNLQKPESSESSLFNKIRILKMSATVLPLPGRKAMISIRDSNTCGLEVAGKLGLPDLSMDLQIKTPEGRPTPLDTLCDCLGVPQIEMTGTLDLQGTIVGTPDMISRGSFTIHGENGVVHKARILSKILAILDVTELFSTNPVKNLMADGYRYDSMDITGTITGHNIHLTQSQFVGAGVNLYGTGYIDLANGSLDLTVLASPFKVVDSLVNSIPVVGKFLGGKNKSLLSVPIRVEGYLDKPRTRILPKPISDMSTNILDAFIYTFKLPFRLSYDLVTGKNTSNKQTGTH